MAEVKRTSLGFAHDSVSCCRELTKDAPGKGLLCCTSSPKMVTQVKVLKAEGLELPKGKGK